MFDKTTGGYRHKNEKTVQLHIAGREPMAATIYHVNGERLTDLLNDPRAFIPMRAASGEMMIVAKAQIASITETCGEDQAAEEEKLTGKKASGAFDPYQVLRIAPGASHAELRAAFRARIKAVHPDTVASLGLDEDLSRAASQATQKIIYAYRKIMRERKTANEAEDAA